MSWQTPITTWGQAGQTVPGVDDFNRIEGNAQHLNDTLASHKATSATTSQKGHVQLSNSTSSTSTSLGATANAVKTVNDALVLHKADYVLQTGYATTTGSANNYAVTLNPAPASLVEGLCVAVKIHVTNTGTSTLNVNGKGAKTIKKPNGNNLVSGNLKAGSVYTVRYNGTNFILQGSDSSGNATPGDVRAGKKFSSDAGTDLVGTFMPISLTEDLGFAISYSDSRHINFFNFPSISGDIPRGSSKSVTFTVVRAYPNITRNIYVYAQRRKIEEIYQRHFSVSVYDNTDSVYLIQGKTIIFNSGETVERGPIEVRLSQLHKNHSYTITVTGLSDDADKAGILNSAIFYVGGAFSVYIDKPEFSIR